jgi:hypothetical protein
LSVLSRGRPRLCWALRVTFVDPGGALLWESLLGATAFGSNVPRQCPSHVRAWFAHFDAELGGELKAAVGARHDELLGALTAEIVEASDRLIAREEAIVRTLLAAQGRMAAPLVQAGLFDRRALRDALAQRRIAEDAAAAASARIHALRRLARPSIGERHLVFAVAV